MIIAVGFLSEVIKTKTCLSVLQTVHFGGSYIKPDVQGNRDRSGETQHADGQTVSDSSSPVIPVHSLQLISLSNDCCVTQGSSYREHAAGFSV